MTHAEEDIDLQLDERDLSSLEKVTYRKRWSSGLLDATVGLAIVLIGICWLFEAFVIGAIVPLLMLPLWSIAEKRIIEPRTGYSEPTESRRGIERKSTILTAALGAVVLVQILFGVGWRNGASSLSELLMALFAPGIPLVLLALLIFVGGIITDQNRGTVYALLFVNVGILGSLVGLHPGTLIVAGGVVILATGLVMLRRFLNRHSTAS